MGRIWLTSDTHYAHKNTLRYCGRPFFTKEQCDTKMIENWNRVVKPEDTVYHLGDVTLHTAPMKRIVPQLNGKKILIIGNHDLMYDYFIKTRGQKFVDRMFKEYTESGFEEIHKSGKEICFDMGNYKKWVRLSHFPTKNAYDPHYSDKHDHAKSVDTGMLNICGHIHEAWLKKGNNINVGVDVWDFSPVSLEKVVELWNTGPENIATPHKFRIFLWKCYHRMLYNVKKVFSYGKNKKT